MAQSRTHRIEVVGVEGVPQAKDGEAQAAQQGLTDTEVIYRIA